MQLPQHTLVGLKYYHPKFSFGAGLYETDLWPEPGSTASWVSVCASYGAYPNTDPDAKWPETGGAHLPESSTIYMYKPLVPQEHSAKISHEIGHKTKHHFPRQTFGPGDHSLGPGLMEADPFTHLLFSETEKDILRGLNR